MALNLKVKVHPVVLFQIVDAYERRNIDAHRVIGTLMGTVDKGVVEVTNSFGVPHKEYEDTVEADIVYAADMFKMNQKVNRSEQIVGWWATGNEVTTHSSTIHEYYLMECNNPVHITLDTTLKNDNMGLKAYISTQIGVPGGKTGNMFINVPIEVTCYQPETVGLSLCQKTVAVGQKCQEPIPELVQIEEASSKISDLLEVVLSYIDKVLASSDCNAADNSHIGRILLDLMHSVPHVTPERFEEMFNSNVKDLLMVITLSQLTKTQLELNEKLTLLSLS
ncbi:eukaryotic translation initiation factor 3 subunit F-1 [Melanaphis sacchari]|uniref:Eukaryotic translation initiation factor 3 subunit F n=1 Tax=Melanaphis sacchari TaxID=742174 RepID=A0A2H8TXS8_9HEMI|nr:eukaryotic translation initiation factor 3 subunit F-1 [Melanaphis sacchari]